MKYVLDASGSADQAAAETNESLAKPKQPCVLLHLLIDRRRRSSDTAAWVTLLSAR
jgi:hypothetical protein